MSGRYRRKLDDAQVADIVTRFQAGATLDELATDYDVTRAAIGYHLRVRGIRRRDHRPPPAPETWPDPATDALEALAAALVPPGPWITDALCAQVDAEMFFPDRGGSTREAKQTCHRCPVKAECLAYALANHEAFGVWGGLSERERRRVQQGKPLPQRTKTCPGCGEQFDAFHSTRVYCSVPCQHRVKEKRAAQRVQAHRRTA